MKNNFTIKAEGNIFEEFVCNEIFVLRLFEIFSKYFSKVELSWFEIDVLPIKHVNRKYQTEKYAGVSQLSKIAKI